MVSIAHALNWFGGHARHEPSQRTQDAHAFLQRKAIVAVTRAHDEVQRLLQVLMPSLPARVDEVARAHLYWIVSFRSTSRQNSVAHYLEAILPLAR